MTWTCDDWNDKPYMRWVGARVTLTEGSQPGRAEGRTAPPRRDGHRGGNGAILAYLHDVVQGAAIRSMCGHEVRAIATLNLNVSFVDAMAAGDLIVGTGHAVSIRSAVAFAESEFMGTSGQVCCRATGTFRTLRTRRLPATAH